MKTPDTCIQLIVGLGNPGNEYEHTRHNAGQDFVEELARDLGQPLSPTPKFFGHFSRVNINGKDVRLLVPTTYMNRSGQAVAAVCQFYKIPPEAVLVVHDELDLPPGKARLKIGGGHGGHNGLRDIISSLGNNKDFGRLRLGIGHPGNAKLVSNYVLKKAPSEEFNAIEDAIRAAQPHVADLAKGDWEKAMRELHSKT
ncbi:aminoacyl-tRNA hydrolase [Saccharophagus degradans]|uniref:Peptidyl-tRNA hydrolase n=1 Tax=Saccharophagus degradans TaxID=86304 RepID=A0AAW7X0Y4_9GAMM|nr:aminoacyl-tRNA hydrolase [Saccharophagus degradans]MBU2985298.1 aminoacyl-tRNA hydrolase [Saccharophagus degradans]MDO6421380.1 aminoacyl-tRNA hydrolase [Saccharophagus degradans]MDO6609576.1 aminoacyl-tRNA hydrolase [Saccharophagus degradans]WGO99298.1 aminoacyl-tRNA hydrolase [Saccharophagus degradans]